MKKWIEYLLLISITGPMSFVYGQDMGAYMSLDDCVEYGLKNALRLKLADANTAQTDAQIMEYRSQGIPKINAVGGYTYYLAIPTQVLPDFLSPAVDGRLLQYNLIDPSQIPPPSGAGVAAQFGTRNFLNLGLESNFMVFDPAFFAGLKAIKQSRTLAIRQKEVEAYQVKSNIANAYISLAHNLAVKQSLERDLENARRIYQESKKQHEAGFIEFLDVQRFEYTVLLLETELEKLDQILILSSNLLKFQMNYPMDQEIRISQTMDDLLNRFTSATNSLPQVVKADRPEMRVFETSEKLLGLQMESTKAGYYPSLRGLIAVNGQLLRNDLFDNNENGWFPASFIGLNLNIPIFDGNYRKGQLRNQKAELTKTQIQKRSFEQSIELEVNNARLGWLNASKSLSTSEKNLSLARNIYQTTQIKFKDGMGSSFELSQAESQYLSAQNSVLEAKFRLLNAQLDYLIALGKL